LHCCATIAATSRFPCIADQVNFRIYAVYTGASS
jgi:hypothetical protein